MIKVGDYVMVFGQRIGKYNFIGPVRDVSRHDGHRWYAVYDAISDTTIACCCHIVERVQAPARPRPAARSRRAA